MPTNQKLKLRICLSICQDMLTRVLYIPLIVPSHMWSTSDDRSSISLSGGRSPWPIFDLIEWSSISSIVDLLVRSASDQSSISWSSIHLIVDHPLGPWSLPICRSSSRLWASYVSPIFVSCLDLGNLIFDPVAVIYLIAVLRYSLSVLWYSILILRYSVLGIAQLNSQSILLNELSRFEITPLNDRPWLLRSDLPQCRRE